MEPNAEELTPANPGTTDNVLDEGEPIQPLSETEPCIVWNGIGDYREMSRSDLSGDLSASEYDKLIWTPGAEVSWESWYEFAGSLDRALEVYRAHAHEFKLIGPGAEEISASGEPAEGEVEFSIEGPVEE